MILLGNTLLVLTGLACFSTVALFGLAAFKNKSYEAPANNLFAIFALLVVIMSALFLAQIINHNYELEYVYSYSSNSLGFFLLMSTFWAGQVGTFLLWLLFTAIAGMFLLKVNWEHKNRMMFFFMLTAVFLVVLLFVKSPFKPLDPAAIGMPAEMFPPSDGRGLNPLLQNFWMVIHPPIVFVGYTLLAIPFAYALAALSAGEFKTWSKKVFPWSLLSGAILGLGIFLGGYWAYETLGWGGYWAWDPVENSSLIPWLTNLALIHGLLLERARATLRKTNILMALLGFILVLYGTFLTRSGVLQEFSVHSFVAPGKMLYWVMLIFMGGFTILAAVYFIRKLPLLKKPEEAKEKISESQQWFETMVILGALFTILLAVLTWVGTSSPLITTILGNPSNVDQTFYNAIAMPIGIIMAILAAVSSLYIYYTHKLKYFVIRLVISLAVAVAGTVVAFALAIKSFSILALIFASFFAIVSNIFATLSMPKKTLTSMAGNITHVGFGLILIGFIASSVFSQSTGVVKLEADQKKELMGMNLKFLGIGDNYMSSDNRVKVAVSNGKEEYVAKPAFYQDPYTRQTVINPYIRKSLFHDTYFAPQRYLPNYTTLTLSKGETNTAFGHDITFDEFQIGSHEHSGAMKVETVLRINVDGQEHQVVPTFYPNPTAADDPGYAGIPNTDYKIYVDRIFADEGKIMIDVVGVGDLVLEITRKPFINLVWFGAVIIVVGTFLAYIKRRKLAQV
jgi:cytochrome c-type biogenesis protein CcmF